MGKKVKQARGGAVVEEKEEGRRGKGNVRAQVAWKGCIHGIFAS